MNDYKTIERGIDKSTILLGLVIPHDYSRHLLAGEETDVQLLVDGSDSNTAGIALGYAQIIVQSYASQLRSNMQIRRGGQPLRVPVDPRIRVWYNSDLKSKNFIVPGLIAVTMMIIASMLSSLTIAREWENGTMEQLLSTPVRPTELVLGKLLAYFALGLADMLISIIVGVFIFQVPFRGNALFLFFHQLPVPVRRALLGDFYFRHGANAAAGLSVGNVELVPAGLHAVRICLLNFEHAESNSTHQLHRAGPLLCHYSEWRVLEGYRHTISLGGSLGVGDVRWPDLLASVEEDATEGGITVCENV